MKLQNRITHRKINAINTSQKKMYKKKFCAKGKPNIIQLGLIFWKERKKGKMKPKTESHSMQKIKAKNKTYPIIFIFNVSLCIYM